MLPKSQILKREKNDILAQNHGSLSVSRCRARHQHHGQASLKDGTYETAAKGNGGDVVFKTTINEGKIPSIEVVKSQVEAINRLAKTFVKKQPLDIDALSGATKSSNAI